MSVFSKQLRKIVEDFQNSGANWPASPIEIANWALMQKRYDIKPPTLLRILSREIAQAMREELFIDEKGRRVRAKHPARIQINGQTRIVWDDMRTARREHMVKSFAQKRNHIVGVCRQVKNDVDSYNDSHSFEEPIQMVLDFRNDVAEIESYESDISKVNIEKPILVEIPTKHLKVKK